MKSGFRASFYKSAIGRKPMETLIVAALILVALVGVSATSSYGQSNSSTATSCPPACQEIVPVLATQGVASVQDNPQPPVFGGEAGMYISNEGSNTVSVVSGTLTAANVPVGPAPLQGVYDPYGGLFYVPDSGANEISVLAGASLDTNIQIQASPLTPAFDPLNGYIYVPNNGGCDVSGNPSGGVCGTTVSVISGVAVIANITVGTAPEEPVVDTNVNSLYYGFVYVPNAASQTISVISGKNNTVVATIGSGPTYPVLVPRPPGGGVYDPNDDTIYMGSYIIQGTDVVGELPILSMPNLVIHPNETPPQFQVSCTASCVYNPYNKLVYEPSDPFQPVFGGFIVINGTDAIPSSCDDCGAPQAVFNPRNGWVYMGAEVISGDNPFALAAPISGAVAGPESYDPSLGSVYGVSSSSAVLLGNTCPQPGGDYNYSAVDVQICNGGGSEITSTTTSMTVTSNGGVNAGGSHVFSIVTSGNIPMASGNWIASGSNIIGQSGGAQISFSLTGQSGSSGVATITILKSEIIFLIGATALGGASGQLPTSRSIASWQPQLYIDGQLVTATTISQDSTYVYVTFPVHFSTHNITMKWIPAALALGTKQTSASNSSSIQTQSLTTNTTSINLVSQSTESSSSSSSSGNSVGFASLTSTFYGNMILVAIVAIVVIVSSAVLFSRRKRRANKS